MGVELAAFAPDVVEGWPTSMRILVFNWRDLAHPRAGGAEVYTHRVAEEWVKEGHHVTLFCAAVEGRPETEEMNGVRLIRRGSRYSVYREARQYYCREGRGNYDIVIDEINTRPFLTPKWVDDVPVIALAHQVCRELWFYQTPWPVALVGRYVLEPHWLRHYRDVPTMTVSESSRISLEEHGLRHIMVVPEGYDQSYTCHNVARESVPTIVFLGRLEPHKRPDHAVRAFQLLRARIPEAKMWVIGSGSMEAALQRIAPEGVEFMGRLPDREKMERLAKADVVVVTSVREGWGLVVTEAARVGTPTIAYDVPGLRDSVKAAGGNLCSPNPQDLALKLFHHFGNEAGQRRNYLSNLGGTASWSSVAHTMERAFLQMKYEKSDSQVPSLKVP